MALLNVPSFLKEVSIFIAIQLIGLKEILLQSDEGKSFGEICAGSKFRVL
jgi:hypothetical protein